MPLPNSTVPHGIMYHNLLHFRRFLLTGLSNGETPAAPFDLQSLANGPEDDSPSDLGSLSPSERTFLNFAVREYLVKAGYKLTAITLCDEVRRRSRLCV